MKKTYLWILLSFSMNEDLANIQYSPIWDYKYAKWFQEIQYNGKTLSNEERKKLVVVIDETIENSIPKGSRSCSILWKKVKTSMMSITN